MAPSSAARARAQCCFCAAFLGNMNCKLFANGAQWSLKYGRPGMGNGNEHLASFALTSSPLIAKMFNPIYRQAKQRGCEQRRNLLYLHKWLELYLRNLSVRWFATLTLEFMLYRSAYRAMNKHVLRKSYRLTYSVGLEWFFFAIFSSSHRTLYSFPMEKKPHTQLLDHFEKIKKN